jgi:hypothetical protein
MTSLGYWLVGIAFIAYLWHWLRDVRALTARPAPRHEDAPDPDAVASSAAPVADPPSAPIESVDDFAQVVAHLEFLGYTVSHEDNGWSCAQHPHRYNFHLRAFPEGIRLDTTVGVAASQASMRAAWVNFLNSANAQSHVTRFSCGETRDGMLGVTMRALAGGAYSRPVFALMMDMWHQDVDQMRRQPDFTGPDIDGDDESMPVTVN